MLLLSIAGYQIHRREPDSLQWEPEYYVKQADADTEDAERFATLGEALDFLEPLVAALPFNAVIFD